MNRKLKAMGLALFAAFAFSAIGAQAASADLFTSPEESTIITSFEDENKHEFSYSIGTVVCETTKFSGTQTGAETNTLTVTPTYEGCTAFGAKAVVRTNHCGYVFTTETVEGDAAVTVECGEGEHIEIEVPGWNHCTLTVKPQTTGGGVSYADSAGTVTVDVTATVTVEKDEPVDNFFCTFLSNHGEGTYTGSSVIAGYEDNGSSEAEFTSDETATTDDRGTTHPVWDEGSQVEIGADTG